MKKILLIGAAAAFAANASGQEYKLGGTQVFKENYSISLVWGNADMVGDNTCRVGTGTNDKFYLNDYSANKVKVFGEKGLIQDIPVPNNNLWICNAPDKVGNLVVRGSVKSWAEATSGANADAYPGCFYPSGSGSLFWVLDTKTDKWVNSEPVMATAGRAVRFDAMGPIGYDAAKEFWSFITATSPANEFMFNDTKEFIGAETFNISINALFAGTAAKTAQTLGTAQYIGQPDEFGAYQEAALYANPRINVTASSTGLGNGIQKYEYSADADEVYAWRPTDKFFVTPQHADIGGFYVFTLNGKDFIVYPGGSTEHSGDAIAISEIKYTDSPASDNEADIDALVARTYGATTENGALLYPTKANYVSYNVEAIPDDNTSVYIYAFCQGCPMVKFKFTYSGDTGVDNIVIDSEDEVVEYYNLNGIRVSNPEGGIFIRKQGTKATKVIL